MYPSSVQIGPAHYASNSEKASCRHDDLKQIKDQLAARIPSELKIIPIVGMGGIGKTTLAKTIYEDTEISHHFHLRAWVTVSQEYNLRNVLLGLRRSMDSPRDEVDELGNDELTQELYRSLKGRRYLVVLDDMWSTESWNDFKWIFPNDNNGSRIMLTSRLMEVAAYADINCTPHCMNCLSNDESWRLLCNQVFVGKPCPPNLVEIGKEIARKCQGLPLAIVVVAGHLSKIDKNPVSWGEVDRGLDSLIAENEEHILDILCLSYNYLPQQLKACFLCMGIFPKNSEIRVDKLIKLWSGTGFLLAKCSENLEDVAQKCLEDLISRNLIMVRKKNYDGNGPAKTCGVHDLLWDLSLREGRKEGRYIFSQSNFRHFHLISITDDMKYLMFDTSTYLSFRYSFENDFPYISTSFSQLSVLDIRSQYFSNFPDEITDLVGLRYLELCAGGNIPGSISKLCNLETFINNAIRERPVLPKEIWFLHCLRHLQLGICTLATLDGNCVSILPNLQTLTILSSASCTEQLFSSIPNVKRLTIFEINGEEDKNLFEFLSHLVYLHWLEKLKLRFSRGVRGQKQIPWCGFFSPSIKQLTLWGSNLPWENMDILAMLPNLEVLKLKKNAFEGPIYEQTVEGFPALKVLLFEGLAIQKWIAETIHFPVLRQLVLRTCRLLEGIPYCFGEIPTLESIVLDECSYYADESAKIIQQEQQNMGNDDLQVCIYRMKVVLKVEFHDDKIKKKVMKKACCLSGIDSLIIDRKEKKLTVTGSDIDATKIASVLREICHTEIVSVGPVNVLSEEEAKRV